MLGAVAMGGAMGKRCYLSVGGRKILSTDVTYDDLIILYQQYIDTYKEVPVFAKCDLKHNMPQGRIINRVLLENNVTYNDFLSMFGKYSHVRTESDNYEHFVKKYIEISIQIGHALNQDELTNNPYGLPSAIWFEKHNPDINVNGFDDFVRWCGFESNRLKIDDDIVPEQLIALEKKLGRPIKTVAITIENVGFTPIVVTRIYGSLGQAKRTLGLMKTLPVQPKPFEYYKQKLTDTLIEIKNCTGRTVITWSDIESGLYNPPKCNHKTYSGAFNRAGVDLFAYMKSIGFEMNVSRFSNKITFDDGEKTLSTMEFDFSTYLRSIGFKYKNTYFRDVLYKTFCEEKGKMNCDYMLKYGGKNIYIEICGIIAPPLESDWRTHVFNSKRETSYQGKMIKKEKRLIESGQIFLFIFKNDMYSDRYKEKLHNVLESVQEKHAA